MNESGRGGEGETRRTPLRAESPRTAKRSELCLRIVFLRKTGGVMRFGEHFCAADFYKRGFCRGNCLKIVLELAAGAVGFLVKSAQRARGFDLTRGGHGGKWSLV